jgi:hypothetical protein
VLENTFSDTIPVTSGVPQGSVLGPCLFHFFINDLPDNIRSNVTLFADDTILYSQISNSQDSIRLQDDLSKLENWQKTWQMKFNPEKCQVLTIAKNKAPLSYTYTLHSKILESVSSAKYLGLTIQSILKWDTNISNICNKSNKVLGFLKRNLQTPSRKTKEQGYVSLV